MIVPSTCVKININCPSFDEVQKSLQRRINIGFNLIVLKALVAGDVACFGFYIQEVVEFCAQLLRNVRKSPVRIRINMGVLTK